MRKDSGGKGGREWTGGGDETEIKIKKSDNVRGTELQEVSQVMTGAGGALPDPTPAWGQPPTPSLTLSSSHFILDLTTT